jgi:predicted alpha/beta hydrolase
LPEPVQRFVDRGADRIGVQVYAPPSDDAPHVLLWPAMGVPARYYRPFAGSLLACGLGVAVADLRGTGASTPAPNRRSAYGYTQLAADVGTALDALTPRPRLLIGHSLGGQACVLHLALHGDTAVDGLVLVGVGLPYWRLYSRRGLGVLPSSQAMAATAAVLGVWPGWGFGGRQARGVMRDWAYTARTGRFPALNGTAGGIVDTEAALRAITTPVLAVNVEGDGYTPPSVLDHLCAKLASAPVRRESYTVAEAGGPLDHFRWAKAGDPLARRVAAFAAQLA